MNFDIQTQNSTVEKNVYCPFCQSSDAFLINHLSSQKTAFQLPDYGKKYLLCVLFTFGLYALVHGIPTFELKRTYEHTTYGFCPHCGKSYNANVPLSMSREEQRKSKVYLSQNNKIIMGLCGGISQYTGLSIKLVRLVMVLYGLSIVPAIAYFICSLVMEKNPEEY
jgi:phage shock protein PspC (stress-responsive transcriptional regulator)